MPRPWSRQKHVGYGKSEIVAVPGRKPVQMLLALVVAVLCSACVGPQRNVKLETHTHSGPGTQAISFSTPADLRLAFLREGKSDHVYCAEPMPDVALGSETSGNGSISAAMAATQAASAASTAALGEENSAIRKQLGDAIAQYEQETGKKYTRNDSSNTAQDASANGNAHKNGRANPKTPSSPSLKFQISNSKSPSPSPPPDTSPAPPAPP